MAQAFACAFSFIDRRTTPMDWNDECRNQKLESIPNYDRCASVARHWRFVIDSDF
jgi:hypothetical protein